MTGMQHGHKKLYGTATVGSKGQVVIPADAREELDLKPGDRMYVVGSMKSGAVVFLKEEMLEDMLAHMTAQIEDIRSHKEKLSN